MIENWKQAYRMLSVWVFTLAGSLAGLEQFLPALEGKIPPAVYACLMILGIVARLIRQPKLQTPETVVEELRRIKSIAKKGGLILLVLLSTGCAQRTPAETVTRQTCLLAAEKASDERADKECHDMGYGWNECPAREAIMAELKTAQEKCR